jgi:hypothetical protein
MAVVINEFEVVPGESSAAPETPAAASRDGEAKAPPSAREVGLLIEQQLQRDRRVWAH